MQYPGWDPETEKDTGLKTEEIWIKYGLWLTISVLVC